jgi:hypothetical protein
MQQAESFNPESQESWPTETLPKPKDNTLSKEERVKEADSLRSHLEQTLLIIPEFTRAASQAFLEGPHVRDESMALMNVYFDRGGQNYSVGVSVHEERVNERAVSMNVMRGNFHEHDVNAHLYMHLLMQGENISKATISFSEDASNHKYMIDYRNSPTAVERARAFIEILAL